MTSGRGTVPGDGSHREPCRSTTWTVSVAGTDGRTDVRDAVIHADVTFPREAPRGIVLFVHGSGSSRFSPRNRFVARHLCDRGFATVLLDALTDQEAREDAGSALHRFDVRRIATRAEKVLDVIEADASLMGSSTGTSTGLFGASTGAAAALIVAARRPDQIAAVVMRGGRPDLAGLDVERVHAPMLAIVGERDVDVCTLNREACRRAAGPSTLVVVPGATHLFEEPGALERVTELAGDFFGEHLMVTDGVDASEGGPTSTSTAGHPAPR